MLKRMRCLAVLSVTCGATLLLLLGATVGCDKGNSGSATKTIGVVPKGLSHVFWKSVKAGMDKAADQAKTAATDAGKATADAARSATDAAKTATGSAVDATKSATSDAAAAIKNQASDWMAKLEDAIKSNKLDEGQTYLDKLDSVKASLPAEWQTKLDSLKATFSAAKAKAAAAIPGLNK